MSHSYICCMLHVVSATADRRPCIAKEMRDRLHAYLGGIARENGMAALAVGGTSDHVHVLLSLPRTTSPAKAVQLLKAGSSKWVNEHFAGKEGFAWQEGYGAPRLSQPQIAHRAKYLESKIACNLLKHPSGRF
jgi:putative transposase